MIGSPEKRCQRGRHITLAYLTRFPFDTIKLDKALVRDSSDKKATVLRSVISMARELDMGLTSIWCWADGAEEARIGNTCSPDAWHIKWLNA
ncbi:EAL domain-containing protein [Rhizobium leguminosarum]|nr:EAL domain-containing protein [Rhizobium leguminosarum]MBY5761042.1 EAL domain-containing protein [Rhizobium leguminosarum]